MSSEGLSATQGEVNPKHMGGADLQNIFKIFLECFETVFKIPWVVHATLVIGGEQRQAPMPGGPYARLKRPSDAVVGASSLCHPI